MHRSVVGIVSDRMEVFGEAGGGNRAEMPQTAHGDSNFATVELIGRQTVRLKLRAK